MRLKFGRTTLELGVGFFAVLSVFLIFDPAHTAVCSLIAVCLHELGHLAALIVMRCPPERIRLRSFGIEMEAKAMRRLPYCREAWVLLAGPGMNLLVGSCCLGRFPTFGIANLSIGLFNILPLAALDGGRLLEIAARCVLDDTRGSWIAETVSVGLLVLCFGGVLLLMMRGVRNLTLLTALLVVSLSTFKKFR